MLLKIFVLIFILFVMIVGLRIWKLIKLKLTPSFEELEDDASCPESWYRKAQSLFTPAEQHFLISLEAVVSDLPMKLYGKPRIADIVKVESGLSKSDYAAAFRKISSKHVDYILVDAHTYMPLIAIELDDSSHEKSDRRLRDAFVDEVMAQAGLPILHVKLAQYYDEKLLKSQIIAMIRER